MPRSLDLVVSSVATQLMEATGSTATRVSENVLEQLVEQFDLDASFLRHHDHDIRASVLVAEWPPSVDVPGNAMEALLAARWLPMPFLADREALSAGAI